MLISKKSWCNVLHDLFDFVHVLKFTGHIPLWEALLFHRLGILFGTEINLKVFVNEPSAKPVVMTSSL
jgi:hypothetical protein